MGYTDRVQTEILAHRRLFGINFGYFYSAGNGLVAKVFRYEKTSEKEARSEFGNLTKIKEMGDRRLNVPEPIDLVNLGGDRELKKALCGDLKPFDQEYSIYAVVMPLIEGPALLMWDRELWERYRNPTKAMVKAMVEHGIYKWDFKPSEVIGKQGTRTVFFVDTHQIEFYDDYDDLDEAKRGGIRHSYRVLFNHDQ